MKNLRWCIVVASLVWLPMTWGDTILLKNGDKISGTVAKLEGGAVFIDTEYAGTVKIMVDHILGIDTDEPVSIERDDGSVEELRLVFEDAEQKAIRDGQTEPLSLGSVKRMARDSDALEKAAKKAKKIWSGTLDSGATFRSGESDTFDATIDLTVIRKKPSNTLTLILNSAYGETDDFLNTQRARGSGKWQYYPNEGRMYYFGVASAEHDKLRRLEYRLTGGGGAGLDIIENDTRKLSAEGGVVYTYERWENFGIGEYRAAVEASRTGAFADLRRLLADVNSGAATPDRLLRAPQFIRTIRDPDLGDELRTEDYWSLRISAKYEQSIFKESKISDELLLLPELGEFGEYRLTNTLAFTTPLSDALSLRAVLRSEFDSEPGAEGIEEWDNILTIGVRWKF